MSYEKPLNNNDKLDQQDEKSVEQIGTELSPIDRTTNTARNEVNTVNNPPPSSHTPANQYQGNTNQFGDQYDDEEEDEEEEEEYDQDKLPQGCCGKFMKMVINMSLVKLTIIGALLGIMFGLSARESDPLPDIILIIGQPGKIFINSLKLLVVPFIAVIMMRVPLDLGEISAAKQLGVKVLCYYLSTTLLASLVGLAFANIIRPGQQEFGGCKVEEMVERTQKLKKYSAVESILQIGETAVPANLFQALALPNPNVLGILCFFLVYGFFLARYVDTVGGQYIRLILDVFYTAFMDILNIVISLTPIGVFSLIARELIALKSYCIFTHLALYLATFLTALLCQILVVYPLLYLIFARKNPYRYYTYFSQPVMTAFASASSAASLPLTMDSVQRAGVRKEVLHFVLPLGATVNMDGSAVYYPVTVLFLAALQQRFFNVGEQLLMAFISAMITIGGAPIPSGALVFLVAVLNAIGVEVRGTISYIWAIDQFMDRCLTATNIFGDAVGAGLIDAVLRRSGVSDQIFESLEVGVQKHHVEMSQPKRRLSLSVMSHASRLERSAMSHSAGGRSRGGRHGAASVAGSIDRSIGGAPADGSFLNSNQHQPYNRMDSTGHTNP